MSTSPTPAEPQSPADEIAAAEDARVIREVSLVSGTVIETRGGAASGGIVYGNSARGEVTIRAGDTLTFTHGVSGSGGSGGSGSSGSVGWNIYTNPIRVHTDANYERDTLRVSVEITRESLMHLNYPETMIEQTIQSALRGLWIPDAQPIPEPDAPRSQALGRRGTRAILV